MRYGLSLLVSFLLVGFEPDSLAQEAGALEADLKEIQVIGNEESASPEYLFGRIVGIATDTSGNIYVADQQTMNVRVFDSQGRHVRTIGRRGRGPGEFNRIVSMTINRKNRLVVADNMNVRMTQFAPDGTVLNTLPFGGTSTRMPRQIGQLHTGEYVLLFHEVNRPDQGDQIELFHLLPSTEQDDTFQRPTASFGRLEALPGSASPFFRRFLKFRPSQFWITSSDDILYAPSMYSGTMLRYQRGSSVWTTDSISGYEPPKGAITPLDGPPYPERATHFAGGETGALIHTISAGLFVNESGHIIHFLVTQQEESFVLGVQVLNQSGTLLGFDSLAQLDDTIAPLALDLEVLWMDRQGRFYIRDRRGAPTVRVVELDYSTNGEEK